MCDWYSSYSYSTYVHCPKCPILALGKGNAGVFLYVPSLYSHLFVHSQYTKTTAEAGCGVKHLLILPQRMYWDFQKGEFVKTPMGIIQSKYKVTVVTNRSFMMGLQHSFPPNRRIQTFECPISKLRGGSLVAAISVVILTLFGLLLTVVLTLNNSVTEDSPGPVGSR